MILANLSRVDGLMLDALAARRIQIEKQIAAIMAEPLDQLQAEKAAVETQMGEIDPTSVGEPDTSVVSVRSICDFGAQSSTTIDHTQMLANGLAAGNAEGFSLSFPPGQFNYEATQSAGACSLLGSGKTLMAHQGTDGLNAAFVFLNASGVRVRGFKFQVMNSPVWPATATLTQKEGDGVLLITSCTGVVVEDCDFQRVRGPVMIFRNVLYGMMHRLRAKDVYHDAFHVTGTSKHITRAFCRVEGGGDDAFPVVGYHSGTSIGQPEDILDIGNGVIGDKYSRGFAYVGSKHVRNIGCYVDGVNADYSIQGTGRALYIASEGSYDTFGNEDVVVREFVGRNIGVGQAAGIEVIGRAGFVTKDIDIEARMLNGSSRAFFCHGAPINDLRLRLRVDGYDNAVQYPNGGDATAVVEFGDVRNLDAKIRVSELSGGVTNIRNTCTGLLRMVAQSTNVCKKIGTYMNHFDATSAMVGKMDVVIDGQTAGNAGQLVGAPSGVQTSVVVLP